MTRRALRVTGSFAGGLLSVLLYQHRWEFAVIILLAARSGLFWVFLLVALVIFLVASRTWTARNRALGMLSVLVSACVAAGLWWFLFVEGPLFNLAAPLTPEYRIYPVECKGKVVAGNFCCGKLDIPLNPTTYSISVARQQVFETTGDFTTTPLHNCEVRDYLNWVCTTYYDATGDNETDMVHGKCFNRKWMNEGSLGAASSGPCPAESEFLRSLEHATRSLTA